MRLNKKIVCAVGGIAVVYAGLLFLIQRALVLPSFEVLERESAAKNMERCLEALGREAHHLGNLTQDWAYWDDTYQFVQDRNETYIASNLPVASFVDSELNLVCYLDHLRKAVWAYECDLEEEEIKELETVDFASLPQNHRLFGDGTPAGEIEGILQTAGGPMLLASRPILTSAIEGPSTGTLLMGRLMNDAVFEQLAEQTRVPLEVWPVDELEIPAAHQSLLKEALPGTPVVVDRADAGTLWVYGLVRDLEDNPILVMGAELPKSILSRGEAVVRWTGLAGLGAGVLTLLVLLLLLRRLVTEPIERLTHHATHVGRREDLKGRVGLDRKDEIGMLATEIDGMFDRLDRDNERRKEAERALTESEVRYRTLVELSTIAIVIQVDEAIDYVNVAFLKLLGAEEREDVEGRALIDFAVPEWRSEVREYVRSITRRGGRADPIEVQFVQTSGDVVDVEVGGACVLLDGNVGAQLAMKDITERKQLEAQLRNMARMDGLTGIPNRREFDATLDKEYRRAARVETPLSLLMIDIDFFKAYNDCYGHQEGDDCIRKVARCLKTSLKRASEFAARYGGEEFAVILPNTGRDAAMKTAEIIREQVASLRMAHAQSAVTDHVTISVGLSTLVPTKDGANEDLVKQADTALYQAKRLGRNQVQVHDEEGHAKA